MKEPVIADYVEHFLDQHNLSDKPKIASPRPTSVCSRKTSPKNHQRKLSYRLSQTELLDYGHQLQALNVTDPSPNQSPRNSLYQPLTPVENTSSNNTESLTPPIAKSHRLSRGASMTSLDAAMISM